MGGIVCGDVSERQSPRSGHGGSRYSIEGLTGTSDTLAGAAGYDLGISGELPQFRPGLAHEN